MGALDGVLFIVWGFPEPTQTFIHRELVEMTRLGETVKTLASHRVEYPGADPAIVRMADEAIYLGAPLSWAARGLLYSFLHPIRFSRALGKIAVLPHRTLWHRVRAMGLVFAAAAVCKEVEKSGARYLHAHFAHHAELAMALSHLTGLPWGATFHAVGIWRERNLLKEKAEQAQVIMTCTANNLRELVRHAPHREDSLKLVYHGLEDHILEREEEQPATKNRLLAVGRLVEKKGLDVLLRALAKLPEPRPPLDIIGDGPENERLQSLAAELGLTETVTFLGRLKNTEVLEKMRQSRALVQPSVRTKRGDIDGIPNVIIEAMATARVCIGTDISGIPEVIKDGETGVLVPPGDVDALAAGLSRVMSDDDFCNRVAHAGQELVRSEFPVRQNVQKQLRILSEVMERLA